MIVLQLQGASWSTVLLPHGPDIYKNPVYRGRSILFLRTLGFFGWRQPGSDDKSLFSLQFDGTVKGSLIPGAGRVPFRD
jgi:hypothetical protein